ncbi:peroxisomal ATPase PEX6 isoform X2 [Entelurus aequoreus]|uniref:peroxisomal ATPase PEX6 isoform X2 n=1 Tax=Entelurus aequoreus TaxID=161455 RepID=UPI002B1E37DB|nr:peroxisomal ATPase PEX6 isoform X2 [Entelurus aequoreus]
MAAQVELLCLASFPPDVSPLDVLLSKSQLSSFFHDDQDPPTLLFTPRRPAPSRTPAILVRVQALSEKEATGSGGSHVPQGRVRLFASGFFLRRHGLRAAGSGGTVRPVVPVSIDRVVLGARSRPCLDRDNVVRLTANLLELCRPGRCLLARQGEPLVEEESGQVELLVLACSPVTQGRITADTSVVLADCQDWWDPPLYEAPPPRSLQLCASGFAHDAASLGGGGSLLDNSGSRGVLLEQEWRLDASVRDGGRWLRAYDGRLGDLDAGLFVSRHVLIKLGLFDGEWVRLCLAGRPDRWRAAVVTTLDARDTPGDHQDGRHTPGDHQDGRHTPGDHQDIKHTPGDHQDIKHTPGDHQDGRHTPGDHQDARHTPGDHQDIKHTPGDHQDARHTPGDHQDARHTPGDHQDARHTPGDHQDAVISETFWFNLTAGEEQTVSCCRLTLKRWRRPQDGSAPSNSPCRSARPPFASELHVRPVASPLSGPPCCYDDLLAAHFSSSRLVSLGDVLVVPCPDLLDPSSLRCPALFFKVQKVCPTETDHQMGGAYLADRMHTSLFMGPPLNSMVPWSAPCPAGLDQTLDAITRVLLPHRHSALPACTLLLHGPAGSGKVRAVSAATSRLHLHLLKVDCVSVCSDTPAALEVKLMSLFQRADGVRPCVLLLKNLQLLLPPQGGAQQDGRVQAALLRMLKSTAHGVSVVATVVRRQELSAGVMAAFVHQVAMESPSEEQRVSMLTSLSQDLGLARDVSLERVAQVTAGWTLGDLSALLAEAGRAACRRLVLTCPGRREEDLCSSGVTIQNQDVLSALRTLQDVRSDAVGAPKIPDVRWEDVGGLQQVKKDILDTVQLPLLRPELSSLNLNRTGILLYGPPGTGKTLLAKAVATECSMTFLSVKGPELLNAYVGQSEENIRTVFHRARSAAPCVVFFDELDSLAPSRGRQGDSGGVMDRVVSQLLAEMDALPWSARVFVIGATNRPDLLDPSLLRPGRLDKLVYVGMNQDRSSQLQVLQAILRNFRLDPAVDLLQVLDRCPALMSGADLYALCSDAMTAAIKSRISLVQQGLQSQDSPLRLSMDHFAAALDAFCASVSQQEVLRYKHLQRVLTSVATQHGT